MIFWEKKHLHRTKGSDDIGASVIRCPHLKGILPFHVLDVPVCGKRPNMGKDHAAGTATVEIRTDVCRPEMRHFTHKGIDLFLNVIRKT